MGKLRLCRCSYPTARVEAEKYKREHSIDAWIDHVESGDTANPFAKNLRQIREMASPCTDTRK